MITRTKVNTLRNLIEKASVSLDDEDALKGIELFPKWQGDFLYQVGERVRYGDALYRCLMTHTSQEEWNPTDAVSLWSKVLIPDPEVIPEWEQPDSTNPYMKGDKVKHLNRTWVSDIDNNVWEPSIYGWSEVI